VNGVTQPAIETRLAALGLRLPAPPRAVGRYEPVILRNGIGYVSGQFPFEDGKLRFPGRLGRELDTATARQAARLAALNVLAQIAASERGFISFGGLLRVDGLIASVDERQVEQPQHVLDAASEVFVEALGPTLGAHTRTLLCVARLPLDAAVELGVTFAAVS
jgi:enamine deaminase RidA (YjgF/YER057c/UK114 family)